MPPDALASRSRAATMNGKIFHMHKGDDFLLDDDLVRGRISCCLGWNPSASGMDLDSSAIKVFTNGQIDTGHVYFGNLRDEQNGIFHSGDNLTGEGDGDDERIDIDLARVSPHVAAIYFCVTVYTNKRTFADVQDEYCRVVNRDGKELCRFTMTDKEAERSNAIIIAKVWRRGPHWCFTALGVPGEGRTARECEDEVEDLEARSKGGARMRRAKSSKYAQRIPQPQPPASQGCCSVQ